MDGFVLLAAVAAAWPIGAGIVVGVRRVRPGERWRTFAWAAVAAAVVALALLGVAFVMFQTNGTTRAMASLGPQILAATCLAGALLCALVAAILRMWSAGRGRARRRPPV